MGGTFYCTVQNIADYMNFLQAGNLTFSSSTTPNDEIVEDFIRQSESEINRFTRDSWKIERTQDYVYLDSAYYNYNEAGTLFRLPHRNVLQFSSSAGDAFEVFDGTSYENYLTTKTEGRANDWWVNYQKGWLFVTGSPSAKALKIRVKYRYNSGAVTTLSDAVSSTATSLSVYSLTNLPYSGVIRIESEEIFYEGFSTLTLSNLTRSVNSTTAAAHVSASSVYYVPSDIKRACTLLTVSKILEFEDRNIIIPENPEGKSMDIRAKHEKLKEQAYALVARHVRPSVPEFTFDRHQRS